jgi:hypothetical protein
MEECGRESRIETDLFIVLSIPAGSLRSLLYPEDVGDKFLRNVGKPNPDCKTPCARMPVGTSISHALKIFLRRFDPVGAGSK